MATKEFNTRIQHKRDTAANWELNDPILLNGEIIIIDDEDEIKYKVGDGISKYSELLFTDDYVINLITQLEESKASINYVETLYKTLNSNTVLGFYCIEDVTIITNGVSKVYPANSNVEVKFIEGDVFEIVPTSNNSILSLTAFPGALGTYYPWLEGVKQFSNILFDMNAEDMYSKWSQGNQGLYQVQYAQYTNCIFWSDNPYISDVTKRTNYTLYYTSQLPLCYSTIPDNTFKAFYLAFNVNSDPNWGNKLYRDSFAKATWATQVFSYYGARTIGIFGHDDPDFNIVLPTDCRGLMCEATAIENAGTFDAINTTTFGAKSGSWRDAFRMCSSLRNLYIKNLKVNINISWSPINHESIYFIISKAANTDAITIYVSPYTYNLLSQSDFELAASKNITITLLSGNYVEDKRLSEIANKANQETVEDLQTLVNTQQETVEDLQTLVNTQQETVEDLQDIINSISNNGSGYEPDDDDIPKVFINGNIPTTKDDVQAEMTYISKTLNFHCFIDIKCQGTSSMKYPKKNFTVKLFQDDARTEKFKVNFRGWGRQNKFCLKANWIDISHSRNIVSARLWGDVVKFRSNYEELPELLRTSPNFGAIDGFPIKVYNNGIYQGRYTWNIPKDKWMTNMDDALDTHCILCGENYDGGCFRAMPIIDESDWSDEIHDTVPASILTRWGEVVNFVMNSTDEEFKTNITEYFDLQSLIDYHIFGLYDCGLDSYGKNQIYMTYDGIKWIGSKYDLDSTWGLYWNGETVVSPTYERLKFEDYVNGRQGNLLYERIEKNFYTELYNRWQELKTGPLSIINVINRFERFTDPMPLDLIKEDYASTTAGGNYSNIPSVAKNNIQQIRKFAVERITWVDDYIRNLVPAERIPCTGITISPTELIFTSLGTQTITATLEPINTTDRIIWSTGDENVATVNNGVVTAIYNGNTTITATCGDYSASCTVSISGINETPGDVESLLYSLPRETEFDGTNYIDTGVCPLASNTPFTILIDWTHTGESEFVAGKHVVAHCMTESNPYPGLILQYSNTGLVSEFRQGSNISSNSQGGMIANADLFRAKVVYRKSADGNITVSRCYNENGLIYSDTKQVEYVPVPENLRLGCYQSNVGGTGRFAKGIMNDCKIYNYALSDDEITTFLTS